MGLSIGVAAILLGGCRFDFEYLPREDATSGDAAADAVTQDGSSVLDGTASFDADCTAVTPTCDGPEDCGAAVCCAEILAVPITIGCASLCDNTGQRRVCHTDLDCAMNEECRQDPCVRYCSPVSPP